MITTEQPPGLVRLRLSRPERRNALSAAGLEALLDAIEGADAPVLVLEGAGEAFCAGADLETVEDLDAAEAAEFAALGQSVARALATYDGASIAAIDGAVRGGGLDLALACDVRACTPRSDFAASGVTIGLLGAWGGTVRLPAVVGPGAAADLALTGRVVGAETAMTLGLVSQVHDDPATVAETIADHDPAAVRATATRLRDTGPVPAREQREREAFRRLLRRRKD